ncbi:MAG: hypothetical protein WBZ36_31215 [Candidatus Nitrosopolaris sp.]
MKPQPTPPPGVFQKAFNIAYKDAKDFIEENDERITQAVEATYTAAACAEVLGCLGTAGTNPAWCTGEITGECQGAVTDLFAAHQDELDALFKSIGGHPCKPGGTCPSQGEVCDPSSNVCVKSCTQNVFACLPLTPSDNSFCNTSTGLCVECAPDQLFQNNQCVSCGPDQIFQKNPTSGLGECVSCGPNQVVTQDPLSGGKQCSDCLSTQAACGTPRQCIDVTGNDNACESCTNSCFNSPNPIGSHCRSRSCQCDSSQLACDNPLQCIDITSNDNACGSCTNSCSNSPNPVGSHCISRSCQCSSTQDLFNGQCVPKCTGMLAHDPNSLNGQCVCPTLPGGTATQCGLDQCCSTGQACVNGACQSEVQCPAGQTACGGQCLDLNSPTSCGTSCNDLKTCGAPTGGTATCNGGVCGKTCPSGTILSSDGSACGCGDLPSPPYYICNGVCTNTGNDATACGPSCQDCTKIPTGYTGGHAICAGTGTTCSCGVQPPGPPQHIENNKCVCPDGQPLNTPDDCGFCGGICTGVCDPNTGQCIMAP